MLNYYVKFENNIYKVIDGNTNRTIATFINEIDAHIFVKNMVSTMMGNMMGQYPPVMGFPMQGMMNPSMMGSPSAKSNFDDSTIQVEDSSFLDDKLGALIKLPQDVYAGNFDDCSLGETSGFKIRDIEEINFLENSGKNFGKKSLTAPSTKKLIKEKKGKKKR